MTSSRTLFYFCLCFIVGVFFESVFSIPQIFIWVFLLISVFIFLLTLFYYKNFLFISFLILFLLLGVLRVQISESNIKNDKLSQLNDTNKNVILFAVVQDEPIKKDTVQNSKIKVNKIIVDKKESIVSSYVQLTTPRYPEFNYLDNLQIEGKLKTPFETDDFSYKNYLQKDGIYSVISFPKIEKLKAITNLSFGEKAYSLVLFLKQKLRLSIRENYLPPESLILEGTILGDNSALNADLKSKLNITGLRHIIAVSGTHIVILGLIVMSFLLFLGLYRNQAFYFTVFFIWIYIVLTGMSASGIRAGIMGSIFLFAQKIGRQSHIERIIVQAAAIILLFNPLLLLYDVGFELSFLAVLGLIYLEEPIREFLKLLITKSQSIIFPSRINKQVFTEQNNKFDNVLIMVSATLSAQVFTLPIMLYNFGNISLVSPITNILILPIVEPLMILGFISCFAGIIYGGLGYVLSFPCYFLLLYFVKIIDIFSAPWMIKTFENVHWIWVVVLYFLIAVLVAFIKRQSRLKFLR